MVYLKVGIVRDVTRDSVIITRDLVVIRNHKDINHKVTKKIAEDIERNFR